MNRRLGTSTRRQSRVVDLLDPDAGDHGQVAGDQRQHARGDERDQAGDEGDRNVRSADWVHAGSTGARSSISSAPPQGDDGARARARDRRRARRRCRPSPARIRSRRSGSVASAIASWSDSSAAAKSPASQAANAASSRGPPASSPFGRESRARAARPSARKSPRSGSSSSRAASGSPRASSSLPSPAAATSMAGIELERPAQRGLVSLRGELVGRRGDERVEPGLDLGRRDRSGELGDHLPVAKRLHRRDALDPEAGREALIRVDVDLRQLDLAGALGDRGLERRAELAARPAPLGPEVDDDRQLAGAIDHLGDEAGFAHILDHDAIRD